MGLVLAALAGQARAEDEGAPIVSPPAVRRSGVVVGLSTGLAVSSARGYPNDVAKIGLPEFESSTGAGVSNGGAFWLGGALADWLTVSVGFAGGSFSGNGLEASGGVLQLRIDSFPMFWRGGPWQDLGVSFTAGTGGISLDREGEQVAEGEGTSAVGTGVFFEPIRFWQISMGPELSYTHQFSRSMKAHALLLGWRLALYGGP